MKYFKYLIGIISLLALLVIANGFLTPSITYTSETMVDKPVEEAMAVMTDESKLSQWLNGLTDIEHISGEKNTVGAVTKYTYIDEGQESIIIETIKSIQPNDHVALSFVMEDVMDMEYKIDFKEKDGKTHIHSSTTTKGTSLLMRSLIPFMKSSMKAQEDKNMYKLKNLIDSNTTNYFPVPVVEGEE